MHESVLTRRPLKAACTVVVAVARRVALDPLPELLIPAVQMLVADRTVHVQRLELCMVFVTLIEHGCCISTLAGPS